MNRDFLEPSTWKVKEMLIIDSMSHWTVVRIVVSSLINLSRFRCFLRWLCTTRFRPRGLLLFMSESPFDGTRTHTEGTRGTPDTPTVTRDTTVESTPSRDRPRTRNPRRRGTETTTRRSSGWSPSLTNSHSHSGVFLLEPVGKGVV